MINKVLTLAGIDRVIIATNSNTHKYKHNADRKILRYEFIEMIVRCAMIRYKDTGLFKTHLEALDHFQ
jgi:hypothetical protein